MSAKTIYDIFGNSSKLVFKLIKYDKFMKPLKYNLSVPHQKEKDFLFTKGPIKELLGTDSI